MRKDRLNCKAAGSGICVYIHKSLPAERLNRLESPGLETLGIHLKPYRLPRHASTILLGVINHLPSANAEDNDSLTEIST